MADDGRPCRSSRRAGCSTIEVDGDEVRVPEGATILDACRAQGVDTPTLCFADNLTPVNACRVCVVEVEGARTLVPACSRTAEDGMKVKTDTERVQRSRKLVMELLASSVEMDLTQPRRRTAGWTSTRRDPERFGAAMPELPAGERDAREPGHHHEPDDPTVAEGVAQPVKIDNELYVRDYSRCILCYKCVEACGVDAQNTFAIAVAGRGFDARISTEYAVRPRRERVRLLRQLHRRVPHRRADVHLRARDARGRHVGRGRADRHEHDLSVLRGRLRARAARAGQRDREGDDARRTTPSRTATCASRAGSASSTCRRARATIPRPRKRRQVARRVTEPAGSLGRHRRRARRRPLDAVRLGQARRHLPTACRCCTTRSCGSSR